VTVAAATGSGTGSANEVLLPGEHTKVTFYDPDDSISPGRYQIVVLNTVGKADLTAVIADLDLGDLWGGTPADTVLAARPAKTWVRWEADSLVRETLALVPGGAILVRVDESAPNDPRFGEHRNTYRSMSIGLKLLP